MNLVGKIFIVLIFVLSLVFMAFTIAVYATHNNWRDEIERPQDKTGPGKDLGLKHQLDNIRKQNADLKKERDELKQQYDAEKAVRTETITKLETELTQLNAERKKREQEYAELVKAERQAVAVMKTTQDNLTHAEEQRNTIATEVASAKKDRDAHFKEVHRLTDELHQATLEKDQLQKRLTTLAADLAKAKEALQWLDVNPDSNYKDKIPPRVDGVVLATTGAGLVEISVGSDQGVRVGHQLQVIRTTGGASNYVGRIEVIKTTPDKSVCKIDPKYQNSNFMKGDRVVSQIE